MSKCNCKTSKTNLDYFPTITLYRGATCEVLFDLSEFDFSNGGHCEFVMKSLYSDKEIKKIIFDEAKEYKIMFCDEFTATLNKKEYRYDIMYLLDDERFPQCKPSKIMVEEVVNEYSE